MLELSNINTYYGRSHILHDVSISVPDGGVITILGHNGVGKTTLLKCIMGLTDRTEGTISFNGQDIKNLPTHERARMGVAYVPQGREIIPDFSIRENILMGCYARAYGKREIPSIVMELFPYLRDNLNRPGGLLSGGQQQQLAIARGLAAQPKLLLLDEPTEGIQPNIVEQIEETIRMLNREIGLAIILIEQKVIFARAAANQFGIMKKGQIVAGGPIDQLTDEIVHQHMTV